MNSYRFYSTHYTNYEQRIRGNGYIINASTIYSLVHVSISFLGKIELVEFSDIFEGLSYKPNKGLVYKYLEFQSHDGSRYFSLIGEHNANDRKVYFTTFLSTIGGNWNLYFNSPKKVNAQGIGDMGNSYFYFSDDSRCCLYLSVLIYTMLNMETMDLDAEFHENAKII